MLVSRGRLRAKQPSIPEDRPVQARTDLSKIGMSWIYEGVLLDPGNHARDQEYGAALLFHPRLSIKGDEARDNYVHLAAF